MTKQYGYIKDGKLYPGTPEPAKQSSQWKAYDHDKQRTDHQWELIQPRQPDGSMNPEFEWAYPEEAQIYKGEA